MIYDGDKMAYETARCFGSRRDMDEFVSDRRKWEAATIDNAVIDARDNPRSASFYAAKAAWLIASRRA